MDKKKFAAAAFDPEHETYVDYVESISFDALPSFSPLDVHPSRRPQISSLIAKKAPTKVLAKYSNFADLFSLDLVSELPEHTRINNYVIKLVHNQQLPHRPIYSLEPVELETLKAYIEINLANGFMRPSKSPTGTSILFDWKSNGSLQLCIDYWSLNNLTIKNRYPLLLIEESLNRLKRAKCFTQLDLTNAYHQMRIRKEDK